MIFLLWNCRGIKNQGFKIHFRELLNYHKLAVVVLTETKAGWDEADEIMSHFNYPHTTKVDAEGLAGGIYIPWNDHTIIQPIALTQQEIYLFVKVPTPPFSFIS